MEKLKNHTLVYDTDCPLCEVYTKGFIRAGMLDESGRVEYGCAQVPAAFNNQRARDEIALVDYETGTVTYGIDSLIKVIGHSFPLLKFVLGFALVRYPLGVLYSFISYNRKVIAPPNEFERRGSCTPTYNLGYRVAYIVFAWLVTSLILSGYAKHLYPLLPESNFGREFIICGGQIIFQLVFVRFMTRDRLMHYIGNMMTVSLIGGLLLLPMMILARVFDVTNVLVFLAWFGLVVTFMHLLHLKRVKMLGISEMAMVTWVVYYGLIIIIIT